MKQIKIEFSKDKKIKVPVKVRKIVTMNTATRVIRPAKGGGYRRKEKFNRELTTD